MIPDIEKASEAEIKSFQETQLKRLLKYLEQHSKYYQRMFKLHNIDVNSIDTLEDLTKIPTTSKDDLQIYNDDFICVAKRDIIDYVTTSGTLGDPVIFGLTNKDLDRLAYNEAISFSCAGIGQEDTVQLMTTIDRRFMAGLAYFLGARELGASIIRVGNGIPELQWDSICKFNPTYIVAVPSFLLKLIEYAEHNNLNINESGVKGAICIGEPLRDENLSLNALAIKIKDKWDIDLYSTYASTEMNTAFTECQFQQGGHHHPELIIVEILNENNEPVQAGEVGELTVTTLGVEAMPLLRFKTGDMLKTYKEPCGCGRNTMRLGPVLGRKQQMIKYKGTTLYPPAIYNVLNSFSEIDSYVIEVFQNDIGTDEILLRVSVANPTEELLKEIKDHFRAKLRVFPKIEFCEKETIQRLQFPKMSRKPILVIDKR